MAFRIPAALAALLLTLPAWAFRQDNTLVPTPDPIAGGPPAATVDPAPPDEGDAGCGCGAAADETVEECVTEEFARSTAFGAFEAGVPLPWDATRIAVVRVDAFAMAADFALEPCQGGGDGGGPTEPLWCATICDEDGGVTWHHSLPQNDKHPIHELIKRYNDGLPEDSPKRIDRDDPQWGTYLPPKCHNQKPGVDTRGGGDEIKWEEALRLWVAAWKKKYGDRAPTLKEIEAAIDHIKNDRPEKLDPPIDREGDLGKKSDGKTPIRWPAGRFRKCFAAGCQPKPGTTYKQWDNLDPAGRRNRARLDCCPSVTEPCI